MNAGTVHCHARQDRMVALVFNATCVVYWTKNEDLDNHVSLCDSCIGHMGRVKESLVELTTNPGLYSLGPSKSKACKNRIKAVGLSHRLSSSPTTLGVLG